MRKVLGNKTITRNLMEASIWFRDLPHSKINNLILNSEFREYKKSEIIYKDFEAKELIFVVSGSVWTCLASISTYFKFGVLLPSSLIGITQILEDLSADVAFFDFRAVEDCQVLAIPKTVFVSTIETTPNQWRLFAEAAVRYHRGCIRLALGMYIGPIKNRAISAIQHFGMAALDPSTLVSPISIDLSQEDLAILIQSSRQHVNKALRELEEEQMVRIGYKKIEIIDPMKLARTAASLMPPLTQIDD